jgi:hypothetical protein
MENEALILDLLEWLAEEPQRYEAVMDAWRSSCPRLTVREDTVDAGYVAILSGSDTQKAVEISELGKRFLNSKR